MLRRVCVTILAMAMSIGCASAKGLAPEPRLPAAATIMHVSAETAAPSAFIDFCRRTGFECEPDTSARGRVELTPQRWSELSEVNDTINRTVIARSDISAYGITDYWTLAGKFGDCEDYALTKQLLLRQRGWPMTALLMTVVRDENGEGHAILTVRTSRGDYVLDNRQAQIVGWLATPYQYVKRQSTFSPRVWMALETRADRPGEASVAALPVSKR